jgi:hypothetical protein
MLLHKFCDVGAQREIIVGKAGLAMIREVCGE